MSRVILRPHEVREIVRHGHTVMVEKNAGTVFFYDADYEDAWCTCGEDRTERYFGTVQDLAVAVNDALGGMMD